ncbi:MULTISPECIES: WXG100 family type VII secretion target [unclassified Granulicatella]|uniref:WXG100 family type VII secretion target n=1 Tax=unclassified Granulicatella TaxID=2630493 RepID=UPI00107425C7|nr:MULTISPECIES: WXG100 family type VII secretion target [unclassified Granulicatella]MBF0780476.1 WXG100 family type VII secretion target [Granulicatella sp. 19428wC4_WM01]TFU95375.1 WXG100 family type VII secretion target [Granulicatella sp. WM01]
MADIKIKAFELDRAITLSQDINKELAHSEQTVYSLKKYLASASWSGKTKESFTAYLELIYQYHKELIEIMKEHEKVIQNLRKTIDDYNDSSEVASIKGL